ncbi:MAG TPA: OsmC family protein [Marmoricola sp.]|jgi:uncharacterized OsmC-like protein|nr:OsmC family protein [Marmoricola sp.]
MVGEEPDKTPAATTGADTYRSLAVRRLGKGRYEATNVRGGTLPIGTGEDTQFTPVELLLAAIAGCASVDVDHITSKRAEPAAMVAAISGNKVRDEHGSHLVNLRVEFDVTFPEGEAGDAARSVLQRSIEQSRDRLCTVSRTVALESPVAMEQSGRD